MESLGDSYWLEGKAETAAAQYKEAASLAYRRDVRRGLEFKLWALSLPEPAKDAVRSLLVSRGAADMDPGVALAGWLHQGPEKDMAAYLLTRRAMLSGRVDQAVQFSGQIDLGKIPLKSVQREAARSQLLVACAALMDRGGQSTAVEQALVGYEALGLSPAEQLEAARVSERCKAPGLHE